MTTPEEKLAALVAQAKRVVAQVNEQPGSTSSDLALSLAHSVIEHGESEPEPEPAPPPSFSFAVDDDGNPAKNA